MNEPVAPARSTELARVAAFFESAQESALLIGGSYGSGKSRLLEAIAAAARSPVYRVRINPKEAKLPHSGLSAILAAFRSPEAIALSEKLLSPTTGRARPAAQASELLDFFHRTATEQSELLLVDDIDLMDHASQTVISMVVSRLDGSRLRMIGTASALPLDGPLASLEHMGLSPISFNESMRLLSTHAGPYADEAILRMVSSGSNGNPGALLHTLRSLSGKELSGDHPIVLPFRPQHDPDPVQTPRATPIAANRRALLARLSCARLSSHEAIAPQHGGTTGTLEALLEDGSVLRQGNYLRVRDPLLRSRVYWSLDAASRADYHATAAAAEEPHDPGLAAWHRSRLDPVSVTADELLIAAARFTRLGFIAQGIELAERVLMIDRRSFGRLDSVIGYVEALFLRGELTHAERYTRLARAEAGVGGTAVALAELRTRIEFMSTQRLPSTAHEDSLNGVEHPANDTAESAAVTAIRHAERWEIDAAKASLERARELSPEPNPDLAGIIDHAKMMVSALEGDAAPANSLYDDLAHHRTGDRHPERLILLGQSLTLLQEHSRARRVFKAILELENSIDPIWRETTRYALADNEIVAGNQLEALSIIDLLNITDSTSRLHQNARKLLMAWYWQATDNRAAAEAAIAECHSSFTSDDNLALTARLECYRGSFALAQGRLDDAVAFLRSATVYGGSLTIPALLSYQVDLIEACVLSGRGAEAAARFQEFHARTSAHRTRWAVLADARAGALVSTGEVSVGAFERAIELWKPGDSRFELGRTLMSYGDRLSSLGRVRDGREQYLAARILFTQHGAVSWAARADAARKGPERETPEHPLLSALTTEERLVAVLACRGLRNKEIAAELFLSQRTVEVRLTRIYHALGVRSRAEMIGALSWLDVSEGGRDRTEEDA